MPTAPKKSEHHPIRKQHNRWLYYSLAAVLTWLAVLVFELTALFLGTWDFPTPFRIAVLAFLLVPAFVLVLSVVMGSRILPWRYSVFGPYERTPPPKGFQAHIRLSLDPQQPHFIRQLDVGRDGLELTFSGLTLFGRWQTRAFLPASSITSIGPATWRTYVVEHNSPEIDGPLVVSQEVGEAILAGLGRPANY